MGENIVINPSVVCNHYECFLLWSHEGYFYDFADICPGRIGLYSN